MPGMQGGTGATGTEGTRGGTGVGTEGTRGEMRTEETRSGTGATGTEGARTQGTGERRQRSSTASGKRDAAVLIPVSELDGLDPSRASRVRHAPGCPLRQRR